MPEQETTPVATNPKITITAKEPTRDQIAVLTQLREMSRREGRRPILTAETWRYIVEDVCSHILGEPTKSNDRRFYPLTAPSRDDLIERLAQGSDE